ncbi:hypothetical protein Pint_05365 [Pistacia integerrima]|uniref:Uncharacterized protein n=1 Tax=Pistacia integerrima TaxID=434235 RepID=A0ACC0Z9L2_9ROSI|nr:hypothetical protein Pint_05365 [Pistacia integerrima]
MKQQLCLEVKWEQACLEFENPHGFDPPNGGSAYGAQFNAIRRTKGKLG